jgi:phosphatidylserine synthase
MVLLPAFLMVSTVRFRSVKAIDLGWRRSYLPLFFAAVALALVATRPRVALVVMAYAYTIFGLLSWVLMKTRRRPEQPDAA